MKSKFQDSFIFKSKGINPNYDYSKVHYVNAVTKVTIICSQHGEFDQTPQAHLKGQGCPTCAIARRAKKKKFSTQTFIEKSKKIHQDKYDYSQSQYFRQDLLIEIICDQHGSFWQRPVDHWNGHGCNKCAIEYRNRQLSLTTEKFINQAELVHGQKYDYSQVSYFNNLRPVLIGCPKHGFFHQKPMYHLGGCDCPACMQGYSVSKMETEWLDQCGILPQNRQVKLEVGQKKFKVDGFDPSTQTIYEFYGDYWHGNPLIFQSEDLNLTVNKTFGELYQKTVEKEKWLLSHGYHLITKWQTSK